mmetsp:Transcript_25034/g.58237  ORF Transcript_25034/g.58237 Transcript_25034/m.58237 type:complete len:393 (+) Transcript_25034:69-1247(+)
MGFSQKLTSESLHVVCLVHLILCVAFICVPADHQMALGGVSLPTQLQSAYAAFCCVCAISIIAAAVGNLYHIKVHVDVYYYMLLLSFLIDIAWLIIFLAFGHSCHTAVGILHHGNLMRTVACHMTSGGVIFCLVLLGAFKVFGMTMASHVASDIRVKNSEELLPYLKKSIGHLANMHNANQQIPMEDAFGPALATEGHPTLAPQDPADRKAPSLSFRAMAVRNAATQPTADFTGANYGSTESAGAAVPSATAPNASSAIAPNEMAPSEAPENLAGMTLKPLAGLTPKPPVENLAGTTIKPPGESMAGMTIKPKPESVAGTPFKPQATLLAALPREPTPIGSRFPSIFGVPGGTMLIQEGTGGGTTPVTMVGPTPFDEASRAGSAAASGPTYD